MEEVLLSNKGKHTADDTVGLIVRDTSVSDYNNLMCSYNIEN